MIKERLLVKKSRGPFGDPGRTRASKDRPSLMKTFSKNTNTEQSEFASSNLHAKLIRALQKRINHNDHKGNNNKCDYTRKTALRSLRFITIQNFILSTTV